MKYQGLGTYRRTKTGRFDSIKSKARRVLSILKRAAIIGAAGYAVFMVGAFTYSTQTVTATTTIQTAPSPVLDRIADCESGNGTKGSASQFKNGQVVMRANTNGTIDIGKYQVNLTYWGKQATALHLDLTKEADNKAMAEYIYANVGTGPWSSSSNCWNK